MRNIRPPRDLPRQYTTSSVILSSTKPSCSPWISTSLRLTADLDTTCQAPDTMSGPVSARPSLSSCSHRSLSPCHGWHWYWRMWTSFCALSPGPSGSPPSCFSAQTGPLFGFHPYHHPHCCSQTHWTPPIDSLLRLPPYIRPAFPTSESPAQVPLSLRCLPWAFCRRPHRESVCQYRCFYEPFFCFIQALDYRSICGNRVYSWSVRHSKEYTVSNWKAASRSFFIPSFRKRWIAQWKQ